MTLSRYSAITNVLQILREVEKAKERKEIWVDQFLADCDCDLDSTINYMEAMHGDLSCAYCGGDCPNDLDNACDEALEVKIPAKITSDCGSLECEFDAVLYFRNASEEQLLQLHKEDYCNSYEADEVALFVRDFDKKLEQFFEAKSLITTGHNLMGYEVQIDRDKAIAWIKDHLPQNKHQMFE